MTRVLLLHAYPYDASMWDAQLSVLDGYEVLAPRLYDLPGETVEAWAEGLLPELGERAAVVGASMGGYVALTLARLAPERLAGLVLVGAKATPDTPERLVLRDETLRELAAGVLPELTVAIAADELARATRLLRDRPDQSAVARGFAAPLLVCAGSEDEILTVAEAERLAASAHNGRLEVFAGAGHLPSLEQPAAFNRVLLDFLAGCR
jgi:pimeloyl-ACP methyl ester carboxylesterase